MALSPVRLFVTLWFIAHQALLSMRFSRQGYWSGLPFPSPGIFPTQGSNPGLLHCRQILYCLSHQGSPYYEMCVCVKSLSHVRLFATLWTVARQAPLFMGFSRQEYWSGLPFPSPGNHPNPGIKPGSPALQANSLLSEPPGKGI